MICEGDWCVQPSGFGLSNDEVHLWCTSVDVTDMRLKSLKRILSVDEVQRATRFYFERDRVRFIVSHGLLRIILGRYLDKKPDELNFCHNRYGKPALPYVSGEDRLQFNVSHSGVLILYAITRGREVGVDIERIQAFSNSEQIVERFFSEREKTEFRKLPVSLKNEAFFTCWTRKEAYIKARGKGMSIPLEKFSVSFVPGEPARMLQTEGNIEENRWYLKEIRVSDEYVAAVVVEGHDLRFRHWEWAW